MIKIENDLIKKLEEGDFSGLRLDLWFTYNYFDYIFATIKGCDKNLDYYVLHFISIYAQYLLFNPNAKLWNAIQLRELIENSGHYPGCLAQMTHEELIDYWNEEIVRKCEHILEEVIIVGSKHYESCAPTLEQLYTSENENVRLYCCANLDYSKFLNDPSPRISKVANIRHQFQQKWNSLNNYDVEKQRIEFLTAALEKGVIQCWDGGVISKEGETHAIFISLLFNKNEIHMPGFDEDIYYTIQDKRILANTLNELIKEGRIAFRDDIILDCFKEMEKNMVLERAKSKEMSVND